MAEYTNQDALLAELLGDVGLLHDAVNSLKDVLPSLTKESAQRLTEIIGLIDKAGDAYVTKKNDSLTAHRIQLDNDLIEANLEFKRNLGALIAEHETAIKNKFTTPVEKLLKTVQRSQHSLSKKTALLLLASIIGGTISGISMSWTANYWTTPKKQRDELAQEIEQNKQTLAQAKTWRVTFTEDKDGKFIILPPGMTAVTGWTSNSGKQTAIKLEE